MSFSKKEHPRDVNNQKFVDKAKVDGVDSVKGGLNKPDKLNNILHKKDTKFDTPEYRKYNVEIAQGLQAVDGLKTSDDYNEYVKKVISGEKSYKELKKYIQEKYKNSKELSGAEEADKVASNITELLSGNSFVLRPFVFASIHKKVFDNVFDFAGQYRIVNITKEEPILRDDTVRYGIASEIKNSVDYDIEREKDFNFGSLNSPLEEIRHIEKFISGLWQIHPFREGNTRTTAVFAIMYLRSRGWDIDNNSFKKHSYYFRNALVRANYSKNGKIHETYEFLDKFFDNCLFGKKNILDTAQQYI